MSTKEFLEYLKSDDMSFRWQYYKEGIYNNSHHLMYKMLGNLVDEGADTITFTATKIIWSKGDKTIYSYNFEPSLGGTKHNLDALTDMLDYDPIVQKYVHFKSREDESVVYEIRTDDVQDVT